MGGRGGGRAGFSLVSQILCGGKLAGAWWEGVSVEEWGRGKKGRD